MSPFAKYNPFSTVISRINAKDSHSRKHDKVIDKEWFLDVFAEKNLMIMYAFLMIKGPFI